MFFKGFHRFLLRMPIAFMTKLKLNTSGSGEGKRPICKQEFLLIG